MNRYYEEWWENPSDPRDFVFKQLNALVMERLQDGKRQTALAVGSGKGSIVSMLRQRDYAINAVELNETFAQGLRKNFPQARVIEGDTNIIEVSGRFDVTTAIEFVQNLDETSVRKFLARTAQATSSVVISVSNRQSIHGLWVAYRRFQKSFVHTYIPKQIEAMLENAGFVVTYRKGVGLLTPITLLPDFRLPLIPAWLTRIVNRIGDRVFPRLCHLY